MAISYSEDKGMQYHIHLKHGQAGKYVILPGNPDRCEQIAAYLEKPQKIAQNREYTTYNGYISGELVTVISTGIGGPSAAIAIEELVNIGAETLIRVGTCGGYADNVSAGDIVIATGAIKMGGTCNEYVPQEFPAVPDFYVTLGLINSAQKFNANYHVGIVESKDSFYGELLPETMPVSEELLHRRAAYISAGCLASEMEGAALFTLGSVRKLKTGMILSVVGNQFHRNENRNYDTDLAIKIAVEAVKQQIDSLKSYSGFFEIHTPV